MELILFQIINGIVQGATFSLIAVGLCLLFGLMNIVNIAHGSFYMLGAVLGATVILKFHVSYWWALLIVPSITGIVGYILHKIIIQFVVDRSLEVGVIATTGLLLVIDNTVLATFGGAPESILNPFPGSIILGEFFYPKIRLVILGICLLVLLFIGVFLKYTKYGLWMRAMARSHELSRILGVPVLLVNTLTMIGVGITTGFAGVAILPLSGAEFQMGLTVLASVFIIVVLGGLDNIGGVVAVAMCFGIINGLLAIGFDSNLATALTLLILAPALFIFPHGIFAGK